MGPNPSSFIINQSVSKYIFGHFTPFCIKFGHWTCLWAIYKMCKEPLNQILYGIKGNNYLVNYYEMHQGMVTIWHSLLYLGNSSHAFFGILLSQLKCQRYIIETETIVISCDSFNHFNVEISCVTNGNTVLFNKFICNTWFLVTFQLCDILVFLTFQFL